MSAGMNAIWMAMAASGLFALALAVFLWLRLRSWPLADRRAATLLPAAFVILAWLYGGWIARMPITEWSAARVTTSVAFATGHPLYSPETSGPMQANIYGPVRALLYTPAALATTPTGALVIGGMLNVAAALLPLLVTALAGRWRDPRRRLHGLVAFAFVTGAILLSTPTRYIVSWLHVDAPAVGLGLLACLALMPRDNTVPLRGSRGGDTVPPGLNRLLIASCFAALATWSKQVDILLVPALALCLAIAWGARHAIRFLCWAAAVGIAWSVFFFSVHGWEETWFNVVVVPAEHKWQPGWTIWIAIVEIVIASSFFVLPIALALRGRPGSDNGRWASFVQALRCERWTIPVVVAVCLAPTSIIGRTIFGGAQNSFHSVYFMAAAAMLVLVDQPARSGRPPLLHVATLITIVVAMLGHGNPGVAQLSQIENNPQHAAYEFALRHPDEAYIPLHPLSTLMADGKLYHFDQAVAVDRRRAGIPPTEEHYRAHLPARMRYVLYLDNGCRKEALRWLPECTEQVVKLEEIPGWVAYLCKTL